MKKSKLGKLRIGNTVFASNPKDGFYCEPVDAEFNIFAFLEDSEVKLQVTTKCRYYSKDVGWVELDKRDYLIVPLSDIRTRRPGIKKPKELSTTVVSKYRF